MKKIALVLIGIIMVMSMSSCSFVGYSVAPDTVKIDGVTYRGGFYGDLWIEDMAYEEGTYTVGGVEYRRVINERFDWVQCNLGPRSGGVVLCAEDQWEEARAYYADGDAYEYYCRVGTERAGFKPVLYSIDYVDTRKMNELIDFSESNIYDPFGSNKGKETCRLPMPDYEESPAIVFYKVSKDGNFGSVRGDKLFIIEGKLYLLYQNDYRDEDNPILVAVQVPDELGQYFVDLVGELGEPLVVEP